MSPQGRTAVVVLVIGGALLLLVPACLLAVAGAVTITTLPVACVGVTLVLTGLALSLWSIRELAVVGRGTPSPADPPIELVTSGPYRWVRNPMALGFVTILLGEALTFGSALLVGYAIAALGGIHLLVVVHEEPAQRRRFGGAFRSYCDQVHRWVPCSRGPR